MATSRLYHVYGDGVRKSRKPLSKDRADALMASLKEFDIYKRVYRLPSEGASTFAESVDANVLPIYIERKKMIDIIDKFASIECPESCDERSWKLATKAMQLFIIEEFKNAIR